MHLPQLLDRDVGIYLSGGKIRMTEQRLDEPDVGSVLEHMSGARVAEQMARSWSREAGVEDMALHEIAHSVLGEGLTVVRKEERLGSQLSGKARPYLEGIAAQPLRCAWNKRDNAVAPPLAASHVNGAGIEVDAVAAQAYQLHTSQGGAIEQFENRPVANTRPRRGVGLGEDRLDLGLGWNAAWQPTDLSRKHEPQTGIIRDLALSSEPAAEGDHGIEASCLRARRESLTAALLPSRKVVLVALQRGMTDAG